MKFALVFLLFCSPTGNNFGQQMDARNDPLASVEAVFSYDEIKPTALPTYRVLDRNVVNRLRPFFCPEMNAALRLYVDALSKVFGNEKGVRRRDVVGTPLQNDAAVATSFDPLTGRGFCPDKIQIGKPTLKGSTAIVIVTDYTHGEKPSKITVTLRQIDGLWKICGIEYRPNRRLPQTLLDMASAIVNKPGYGW
jgi:hypothetical protein